MIELEINATGLEAAIEQLKPQRLNAGVRLWYQRIGREGAQIIRARAPGRLKNAFTFHVAGGEFPPYVRIGPDYRGNSDAKLAHLVEHGTGTLGDSDTQHAGRYFPNVNKLAKQAGLEPRPAFLVARAIFLAGGTRPRPFVRPVTPTIEARAVALAQEMIGWA